MSSGERLATQQSLNGAVKAICDVMRRSNCAGALQYVPELTWILFLRILDEREAREGEAAEAVGAPFTPTLGAPYRGFLAQSYEYMRDQLAAGVTAEQIETLRRRTFYGREKDNAIYPIALANLVLHDVDEPHLWHGNTLTGAETYAGLFADAPDLHDIILMNPPFGGREGQDAQTRFAYKAGAAPPRCSSSSTSSTA